MKNKQICTALVLIALGLLIIPLASAIAEEAPTERYVFNVKPKEMSGVTMSYPDSLHELHVVALANDCTACHFDNDETRFMGVSPNDMNMLSDAERTEFIHNTCTSCHVKMQTGPTITSCRSCHTSQYDAETGLDRVMR